MGRIIILSGILIILLGGLIWLFEEGKFKEIKPFLPGDILIKKDNFIFFFPLTTSIIISIILTAIFMILKK